jgi:hypothetical protein
MPPGLASFPTAINDLPRSPGWHQLLKVDRLQQRIVEAFSKLNVAKFARRLPPKGRGTSSVWGSWVPLVDGSRVSVFHQRLTTQSYEGGQATRDHCGPHQPKPNVVRTVYRGGIRGSRIA